MAYKHLNLHRVTRLSLILLFELLLYHYFLVRHYSTDCYLTYFSTQSNFWSYLLSGRLVSSLMMYLTSVAHINLVRVQIVSTTLSLVAFSFAIDIAIETARKMAKRWSLKTEVLVAVSLVTVLNSLGSVEHAVFTFQMPLHALALLVLSLSLHSFFLGSYRTYFLYVTILPLINQAYIPLPISLIIAFLLVYAVSLKSMMVEVVRAGAPLLAGIGLSAIAVMYVLPALGYGKRMGLHPATSLFSVFQNMESLLRTVPEVFSHWGFFPPAPLFSVILLVAVVACVALGMKSGVHPRIMVFGIPLLIGTATFLSYLPHILSSHLGPRPRTMLGVSALPGLFFLAAFLREPRTTARWHVHLFGALLVMYGGLVFVFTQNIESDQILLNSREKEYARRLVEEISMQEKAQGVTATKMAFTTDSSPTYYYPDMVGLQWSINATAMSADWAFLPMIRFYTGRSFEAEALGTEELEKFVAKRNWTSFDVAQVSVRGDTAYVITY